MDAAVVVLLRLLACVPDLLKPDLLRDELPCAYLPRIVKCVCWSFAFFLDSIAFFLPAFHKLEDSEYVLVVLEGSLDVLVDLDVLISVHKFDQVINQ